MFLRLILVGFFIQFMVEFVDSTRANGNKNDLSLNTLTKEGDIGQMIYANKRIGSDELPMFGFHDKNSENVVLISTFSAGSNIQLNPKNCKSYQCANDIYAAGLGYTPDIQSLFNFKERVIQSHKNKFGDNPSINKILHELSRWLTNGLYSQSSDDEESETVSRPYSVNILIADSFRGLHNIENTGNYHKIEFGCIGKINEALLIKTKQTALNNQLPLFNKISLILKSVSEYLDETHNINEDTKNLLYFEVTVINPRNSFKRIFSIRDENFVI